ncbi:MAG TPA: ATP-binding protein [Polyangiales bacterium]|nr:ATP-binding protein [Polyangiales bacterium]
MVSKLGWRLLARAAADSEGLRVQALTNLLLNARDASPRGSIVRLSVEAREGQLAFSVEDEGEGISAQSAARADEPFFTTKAPGRGNGLGLAITREPVRTWTAAQQVEAQPARS